VHQATDDIRDGVAMKVQKGRVVTIRYTLLNDQGVLLEQSTEDNPLTYLHGYGNIVPGLEKKLDGHDIGYTAKVIVSPTQGYGERDEELVF